MRKIISLFLFISLFTIVGCNKKQIINYSKEEEKIVEFIENKGYKIKSYDGEVSKYVLDKSKIWGTTDSIPYQQIYGVQDFEADKYFGEEITTYKFIVENHPLQNNDSNAKDGVQLYIMTVNSEIIGGYSYPNSDATGAFTSLEGKTLEEVSGLSFEEWQKYWEDKYSK